MVMRFQQALNMHVRLIGRTGTVFGMMLKGMVNVGIVLIYLKMINQCQLVILKQVCNRI